MLLLPLVVFSKTAPNLFAMDFSYEFTLKFNPVNLSRNLLKIKWGCEHFAVILILTEYELSINS